MILCIFVGHVASRARGEVGSDITPLLVLR